VSVRVVMRSYFSCMGCGTVSDFGAFGMGIAGWCLTGVWSGCLGLV
jgi:hypothetical protein